MDTPGESVTQRSSTVWEKIGWRKRRLHSPWAVGEARSVSRTGCLPAEPGVRRHDGDLVDYDQVVRLGEKPYETVLVRAARDAFPIIECHPRYKLPSQT
jgi:hypothetical protein